MAVVFEKPKSLANVPLHYCPGCPHGIIHRLVAEAIDELGIEGKAIGVAAVGSFIGGIVSTICLIFISPQLAKVALKFHSADYFALALFGISIMASSAGKNVIKGLIAGAIGLHVPFLGEHIGVVVYQIDGVGTI